MRLASIVGLQRKISVALIMVLLSVMLAACGGDTQPAATTDTPTAATSSGDTQPTAAPTNTAAMAAATPTTAAAADTPTTAAASTPSAAASGTVTTTTAAAPTLTPIPPVPQAEGSTKLTFWFGLTGANGNIVRQVVNKFNTSQTKYYVEAIQQPDYDNTINKLNASLAGGALPNVVQVYDIGTQRMIDSKRIIPVQDLVEKDGQQAIISDLEPAVASYYTVNGKLYSMPFNSSAPVMYYNKTAFKEVGLDPDKPPTTYDEVLEAAKKLTKKDSSGKIIRSGVDFTL